jgi:hypothetical protein
MYGFSGKKILFHFQASGGALPPVSGQSGLVVPVYGVGLSTITVSVPSSELTLSPSAPPRESVSQN